MCKVRRKVEDIAILSFDFQSIVCCLRVDCWWEVMVTSIATIGFCYKVWCIALGTRGLWRKNKRSIRMLTFIFNTKGAKYTWCILNVFWGEGLMVTFGWKFLHGPHRLMYCNEGMAGKLLFFQTIGGQQHQYLDCRCHCLIIPIVS